MRSAKVPTAVLWTVNAAVAAAVVVTAFQQLFFRSPADPLRDVEPPAAEGPRATPAAPPNWKALQDFGNPVVPREAGALAAPSGDLKADLLGTLAAADPSFVIAYLWIKPRGAYVNAYIGEPVLQDGQPVAEVSGWTLVRVGRDSAVFSDGTREQELRIKDAPILGGTGPLPSMPGDRSKLKPVRVTAHGTSETYTVDKAGAAWAAENADALLREVTLQDYAGGGIQILSIAAGSPLADLGFQDGDVIKSVNGQAVANSFALGELKNHPALAKSSVMVQFERAGQARTVTITVPGGGR